MHFLWSYNHISFTLTARRIGFPSGCFVIIFLFFLFFIFYVFTILRRTAHTVLVVVRRVNVRKKIIYVVPRDTVDIWNVRMISVQVPALTTFFFWICFILFFFSDSTLFLIWIFSFAKTTKYKWTVKPSQPNRTVDAPKRFLSSSFGFHEVRFGSREIDYGC